MVTDTPARGLPEASTTSPVMGFPEAATVVKVAQNSVAISRRRYLRGSWVLLVGKIFPVVSLSICKQ
jgi:hypothetical protein